MKKLIQAFALLVGIFMILPTHANAGRPQLYQQQLEVGRALLEVHFANVDEVLPYYADDIEYHDPIVDIYGIQDMTGVPELEEAVLGFRVYYRCAVDPTFDCPPFRARPPSELETGSVIGPLE